MVEKEFSGEIGNLFQSLRETSDGGVCVEIIRGVMDKCGLSHKLNPSLKEFQKRLDDLAGEQGILPKDFTGLINTGGRLITRAIRGELVVPDFHRFRQKCREIFEGIDAKDPVGAEPARRDNVPRLAVLDDEYPFAKNADYIPKLKTEDDGWGISVCTVDGQTFSIGDTKRSFSIQSCSKPFNYGYALETFQMAEGDVIGKEGGGETTAEKEHRIKLREKARIDWKIKEVPDLEKRLGVHDFIDSEPSGQPFNGQSFKLFGKPYNPLINAGAIMCCGLIMDSRPIYVAFPEMIQLWQKLSGNQVKDTDVISAVFDGEKHTGHMNRALAFEMMAKEAFPFKVEDEDDVENILEFYFKCCGLGVTADEMSVAAATLANQGVCPPTGERVFHSSTVTNCLASMLHCGMYDSSGKFGRLVGLPAKSGVGGGIILVIPGVMGICTYSPRLDKIGNSLRGLEFFEQILEEYALHMLEEPSVLGDRKIDIRRPILQSEIRAFDEVVSAASQGDLESLTLVEHHAGGNEYFKMLINQKDYDGRTALHLAAAGGHVDMVKALLEKGANPKCLDRWGELPINDAIHGNYKEVEVVLKKVHSSKKTKTNRMNQWSPTSVGKEKGEKRRAKFHRIDRPLSTSIPEHHEMIWAAAKGDLLTIRRHVAWGRNLHVADYDNRTPLHLAAAEGHVEVLKFLLNYFESQVSGFEDRKEALNARLSWPDRWGRTPLDEVIEPLFMNDDKEVRRRILEAQNTNRRLLEKAGAYSAKNFK